MLLTIFTKIISDVLQSFEYACGYRNKTFYHSFDLPETP